MRNEKLGVSYCQRSKNYSYKLNDKRNYDVFLKNAKEATIKIT